MNRYLIPASSNIVEALNALNGLSGDAMTLFVTDADGRLKGSVTDGDIRRALISGHRLEDSIADIARKDFKRLETGRGEAAVISEARQAGITLLPMVRDGYLVKLVDLRRRRGWLPAAGVLMAGGRGERLRPLTLDTPKPLLEVGGAPIIGHNIELMQSYGVEDIYITVNYLKEKIVEYVGTRYGEQGAGIRCVEEPRRLGTMGSLSLVEDIQEPNVIVMNSDLLTDVNLEALWLKHIETEADITVAVVPYNISIPYAIMRHSGDRVEGIEEKPTFNYYANGGIYLLRKEVRDALPKGEYLDAPDLIDRIIGEGGRVSQYVMEGRWIDIGSPDDYRHACELMGG